MKIKSLDVKSGGNRLIWDMRYPGFTSFEGMVLYSSPNVGPKCIPGNYKVKMYYNNEIINQDFLIVKDPRIEHPRITGSIAAFNIKVKGKKGYLNSIGKIM